METADLNLLPQAEEEISQTVAQANVFLAVIHGRHGDGRRDWIAAAQVGGIGPLCRFAQGLFTDFTAILAGVTRPINNGQLAGYINQLKMIERQFHGRASADLLR